MKIEIVHKRCGALIDEVAVLAYNQNEKKLMKRNNNNTTESTEHAIEFQSPLKTFIKFDMRFLFGVVFGMLWATSVSVCRVIIYAGSASIDHFSFYSNLNINQACNHKIYIYIYISLAFFFLHIVLFFLRPFVSFSVCAPSFHRTQYNLAHSIGSKMVMNSLPEME